MGNAMLTKDQIEQKAAIKKASDRVAAAEDTYRRLKSACVHVFVDVNESAEERK